MVTVVDLTRHAANQIGQMLFGNEGDDGGVGMKIPVKVFTDSLATLESIASTHQVERRLMRSSIADLKQKLEQKDVDSYGWIQDEEMVADILTKDMKDKLGLNGIIMENRLCCVTSDDNKVTAEDGEFVMTGRKLKEKLQKK